MLSHNYHTWPSFLDRKVFHKLAVFQETFLLLLFPCRYLDGTFLQADTNVRIKKLIINFTSK